VRTARGTGNNAVGRSTLSPNTRGKRRNKNKIVKNKIDKITKTKNGIDQNDLLI
jgi:hypothetical protein